MVNVKRQPKSKTANGLLAGFTVLMITAAGISLINLSKASTREVTGADPYGVKHSCITKPLATGSTGPCVLVVQSQLNTLNAGSLVVNGTYDATTATAVKNFQTDHQLSADGTMNQDTWKALLLASRTTP